MKKKNIYADQLCERCGSKKRIAKTWKEKIPTMTGSVEVEFSQIECTNEECQVAFDKKRKKEEAERKTIRDKKEEADALRLKNSLSKANSARKTKSKNKSRI